MMFFAFLISFIASLNKPNKTVCSILGVVTLANLLIAIILSIYLCNIKGKTKLIKIQPIPINKASNDNL